MPWSALELFVRRTDRWVQSGVRPLFNTTSNELSDTVTICETNHEDKDHEGADSRHRRFERQAT